jgi:hypothetical protein
MLERAVREAEDGSAPGQHIGLVALKSSVGSYAIARALYAQINALLKVALETGDDATLQSAERQWAKAFQNAYIPEPEELEEGTSGVAGVGSGSLRSDAQNGTLNGTLGAVSFGFKREGYHDDYYALPVLTPLSPRQRQRHVSYLHNTRRSHRECI